MQTFKEFILESKKVGTIYHYTTMENLHNMLHQEHPLLMGSQNNSTISASRNSNLPLSGGHDDHFYKHGVRIVLDGDKISEHHKVRPVSGLTDNESDVLNHKHNSAYRVKRSSGEAEEAIMKVPFDAKPYIKHINIIKHRDNDEHYEKHIKPKLDELGISHSYSKNFYESFREEFLTPYNQMFIIEV